MRRPPLKVFMGTADYILGFAEKTLGGRMALGRVRTKMKITQSLKHY